ncbi:Aspartate 1-decarboxylase [Rhodovastum atsumiense]|uniref:aspartate 1-decarboxylase n=1 Tax=Rhodovastum atsumiense TaxID=504468 RepID=UPI00139F2B56|nr:Aspartate 1-decarboxylase [Rhodovastum atsumiense]
MRKVVAAKLHGITVTESNLNYHGSITLDPDHCEAAGLLPMEFVEIWNRNSGARISTYVIYGERGSRCCVLNGAAARTCQPGDAVIICSSAYIQPHEIASIRPTVLTFDAQNHVTGRMTYVAGQDAEGRWTFSIHNETGNALPIPLRVGSEHARRGNVA